MVESRRAIYRVLHFRCTAIFVYWINRVASCGEQFVNFFYENKKEGQPLMKRISVALVIMMLCGGSILCGGDGTRR